MPLAIEEHGEAGKGRMRAVYTCMPVTLNPGCFFEQVSMHVAARAFPSHEHAGLAIHEIVNVHRIALGVIAAAEKAAATAAVDTADLKILGERGT